MSDTELSTIEPVQTSEEKEELLNEIIHEADGVNDGLASAEEEFVGLSDYDVLDELEDEEDADGL